MNSSSITEDRTLSVRFRSTVRRGQRWHRRTLSLEDQVLEARALLERVRPLLRELNAKCQDGELGRWLASRNASDGAAMAAFLELEELGRWLSLAWLVEEENARADEEGAGARERCAG